jgi:hypothetical protein
MMHPTAQSGDAAWGTRDAQVLSPGTTCSIQRLRLQTKRWLVTITSSTGHVPLRNLLVPFSHEFLLHVCRLETPPDPARLQSGLFIPVHFPDEPNRIRYEPGPVPLVPSEGQRGLISGYQGIGGAIRRRKDQATKGALV